MYIKFAFSEDAGLLSLSVAVWFENSINILVDNGSRLADLLAKGHIISLKTELDSEKGNRIQEAGSLRSAVINYHGMGC